MHWELASVFAPEQIKCDIFDLLCCGGGAVLQNFVTPYGQAHSQSKDAEGFSSKSAFRFNIKPFMKMIHRAEMQFKDFYKYHKYDDVRRKRANHGKTEFFQVWQSLVPDRFKNDRVRAERVGVIVKFNMLTYCVRYFSCPFKG